MPRVDDLRGGMTRGPAGLVGLLAFAIAACGDSGAEEPDGGSPERDPLDWCLGRADHKPVALAGGDGTLLILFDDGTVYCMGDSHTRQCDAKLFYTGYPTPWQVPNMPCLTQVAASSTPLGILTDGRAIAWGGNATPAPGESAQGASVQVLPLESVSFVYSMGNFMAAIAEGKVSWWGTSYPDHAAQPTELLLDGPGERLTGSEGVSCYLFGGGALACRGRNQSGLLGPGHPDSALPVIVDLGGPALDLLVQGGTACALRVDGEVVCWGHNDLAFLGRGKTAQELASDPDPAPILETGPFVGISSHSFGACAWRESGEVFCWGDAGTVHYESEEAFSRPPRRVPHLEPARQVAMIDERVCALGFDDQVRCHIKNVDPDVPPSAEVMEFAPPLTAQEQLDAASR